MASRMIHIAVCIEILNKLNFIDKKRFFIGELLPDAISKEFCLHDEIYSQTHFKKVDLDRNIKYYDFENFYQKYAKKILSDDMYLGFLVHIMQDAVFRKFFYDDLCLNEKRGENNFSRKLYKDYSLINEYLINKYKISFDDNVFQDVWYNGLNEIYNFDIQVLIDGIKKDFEYVNKDAVFSYLNLENILEYISKCSKICIEEILNIKSRRGIKIKSLDYSYDLK